MFRTELYFNILMYFSLGHSHAQEILTTSFRAPVTGNSVTTECDFSLSFTDVEILKKSKVSCGRVKKTMTINSFTYELKSSMHIIREAFKDVKVFFSNLFNSDYCLSSLQCLTWQILKASHILDLNWKYSRKGRQLFKDQMLIRVKSFLLIN